MSGHERSARYAGEAAVSVRGDGETVVLMLHGLGGDRHQPLGLLTDDLDRRVTIVAPDQRGHGETTVIGQADDFVLDALADDAAALLTARGLADRPLVVTGISLGAAVALRLVQRGDHDLRGAVLIRPAFETEPWPEHLRVFREIAGLLHTRGAQGRHDFVRSPAWRRVAEVSPAAAASLEEQFTKPGARDRVVRLESVPANPSIVWPGVWTPPCPILVVGAEGDPMHPLRTSLLWHERIAGSHLEQLPSRDRAPEAYASRARVLLRAGVERALPRTARASLPTSQK